MKTATKAAHGTYTRYTTGACRCPECHKAMLRYNKRRAALIERGEWSPWRDISPARQHVQKLRASGMPIDTIAAAAGVASANIYKLFEAGRTRVRASFADRLLAVHPESAPPPWARVNAAGTRRRLQALMFAGWSATYLADRLGMDRSSIRRAMDRQQVEGSTARAVKDLFDELSSTSPPEGTRYERMVASRSRRLARERGYPPAAAWDDIDNPNEKPKGVRREAS